MKLTELQKNFVYDLKLDGFIDIGRDLPKDNYNFVTIDRAVAEGAFILFYSPYYHDDVFDFLHAVGYRHGKDYLFYTT